MTDTCRPQSTSQTLMLFPVFLPGNGNMATRIATRESGFATAVITHMAVEIAHV